MQYTINVEDSTLHKAAYGGDVGQLASALVGIDDVDNRNSTNYCTPLHLAIRGNRAEAIRVLLMAGADPQLEDELEPCYMVRYPAVEAAAYLGHKEALVALIEFGVPVPGRALRLAASHDYINCLQTIFRKLQCENSPDTSLMGEVRAALYAAATCWHGKAVDFLLTKVPGFPDALSEVDRDTLTTAMLCLLSPFDCDDRCRQNYARVGASAVPILEQLVKAGACVDNRAFWSSFSKFPVPLEAVRFLLKRGLKVPTTYDGEEDDVFAPHPASQSMIFRVVGDTSNDTSILDAFLAAGASVMVTDWNLNTPLHCATHSFAETLIEHGADIHAKNAQGQSPLYTACMRKHIDVARLLISRGADVNGIAQDEHWLSLMSTATGKGEFFQCVWDPAPRLHLTELILSHGGNVNAAGGDGDTALHMATRCRDVALVQYLIERGAEILAITETGQSVLHTACIRRVLTSNWPTSEQTKTAEIIQILLNNGANPNAKDGTGATPLHCLIRDHTHWNWSPESVNALLERGADMDVKDDKGKTPRELLDISKWFFDDTSLLKKALLKPHVPTPSSQGRGGSWRRAGRGRGGYRSTWT